MRAISPNLMLTKITCYTVCIPTHTDNFLFFLFSLISRTRGFDRYEEGGSIKETPKSPPPPHHHHSSPYQRQQEQRTYPAPGQYRHSSVRSPTSESDKPSSLIADTYKQDKAALEAKEEPVEQPNAFDSSYTGQSYDVDNWQDKHSTPPSRPRFDYFKRGFFFKYV